MTHSRERPRRGCTYAPPFRTCPWEARCGVLKPARAQTATALEGPGRVQGREVSSNFASPLVSPWNRAFPRELRRHRGQGARKSGLRLIRAESAPGRTSLHAEDVWGGLRQQSGRPRRLSPGREGRGAPRANGTSMNKGWSHSCIKWCRSGDVWKRRRHWRLTPGR